MVIEEDCGELAGGKEVSRDGLQGVNLRPPFSCTMFAESVRIKCKTHNVKKTMNKISTIYIYIQYEKLLKNNNL